MQSYTEHQIQWQGINIEVRHCHRWVATSGNRHVQHIELRSENRAPLPITETGYKSHFLCGAEALADYSNSPARFVLAWLEHEAKASKWSPERQMELF